MGAESNLVANTRTAADAAANRVLSEAKSKIAKTQADRTAERLESAQKFKEGIVKWGTPFEKDGQMVRERTDAQGKVIETQDLGSAKDDFAPLRLEDAEGNPILVPYGDPIPADSRYPVNVTEELTPGQEIRLEKDLTTFDNWINSLDGDIEKSAGYVEFYNRHSKTHEYIIQGTKPPRTVAGVPVPFTGSDGKYVKVTKAPGSTTVKETTATPDTVTTIRVTSPDGAVGSIPASQLDEAIKAGYKRIE